MSGVRHLEITLQCDPVQGLIYKVLLRKGQPLRTLMTIQSCVLQHFSPMKSFPLKAEHVGLFSCSQLWLVFGLSSYQSGEKTRAEEGGHCCGGRTTAARRTVVEWKHGVYSQGEAWDDGCFTLGNTGLSDGTESCFSLLFAHSLSYFLLARCLLPSVTHKNAAL